ncbi:MULTISPECIES: hypothetical protein [unclassified Mesorhizobium]|uniref:hypothetical protein n=1 Tax=unclassified Mesorhizobium TaxID=325217 RepID=UPI000F75663D|nr:MULTISPECIES: hypothetical protein [unclassified Mesorhizobium]AZO53619.1 hypothetical protein EJ077_08995 [Mesorhizobium sp. M8A.F.Ca.ET.057.01.1.1]RWE41319.1 MAG: hypothetical protein EOS80_28515 [Mesorhizobium sp.]
MLAISALFFAAAVWMEGTGHREPAGVVAHDEAAESQEQGGHDEAGESSNPKHQDNAATSETSGHAEPTFLGMNLEDSRLVWGFVAVSILLAVAVMRFGLVAPFGNATLLLAIVLAGVAAILDGREVFLQLDRANASVAGLAGLTALTHIAVVVLAALAWRAASPVGPATTRDTQ